MRALLVLMVLVGCGTPGGEFVGTYQGDLTQTGCTGAAGGSRTEAWVLTVVAGPRLEPGLGSCRTIDLEQAGAIAKIPSVKCPSDGVSGETNITDGTLTLDGKKLAVTFGITAPGCELASFAGTLTRR